MSRHPLFPIDHLKYGVLVILLLWVNMLLQTCLGKQTKLWPSISSHNSLACSNFHVVIKAHFCASLCSDIADCSDAPTPILSAASWNCLFAESGYDNLGPARADLGQQSMCSCYLLPRFLPAFFILAKCSRKVKWF